MGITLVTHSISTECTRCTESLKKKCNPVLYNNIRNFLKGSGMPIIR
jgi:hypothetical protein